MRALLLLCVCSTASAADFYKIDNLKRIDSNLYRSDEILIETRYCYEFAFSETVILKYEGPGQFSGSKVIWSNDSNCDVKRVAMLTSRNLGYVPGLQDQPPYDSLLESIASGGASQRIPTPQAPPDSEPRQTKPTKKRTAGRILGEILGGPKN